MECRLLGDLEVVGPDGPLDVRGVKQRALLALLILHRGEVVPTTVLLDALWGEDLPQNPVNALQSQISQLRRTLPDGLLVSRGGGYGLDAAGLDVDLDRFDAATRTGRRQLDDGDAAAASATLTGALDLWRGPALAEFADHHFARPEATRLETARLAALQARIDADLALGRHAEVLADLEALCQQHPLQEHLWAQRMVALYRSGRQGDALRAYAEVRRHLVDELGVEPGPELRRAEALVLAQADELAPDPLPAGEPATAAAPPSRRGNLPARLTRFVGREAAMEKLTERLAAARLVTLVGPGGVGKTRLAIEAADRLADDLPDGAWLVELAGVTDPSGLLPAVAAALGAGDTLTGSGRQAPARAEDLAESLAGRAPLLILDNCEHLITAVAELAETLLTSVGGLRILATSREALGVPGEHLQPVGPLEPADAAELFADRAAAMPGTYDPADPATAELGRQVCERLDRLPLAIELAAARLRALPLPQLAERLDNRFRLLTGGARTALPRQQTLRAVVDWSYDLLFDDERRLFQRLAVFVGGCRLDAAEAVCADADVPAEDVVDLIGRLVDKSLVEVRPEPDGQLRYLQLQTLWQYGREKLLASGEAAQLRRRHADWYGALCDGASDRLRGPDGPATRQLIRAELENIRSALDWVVEEGRAEQALRIVNGIAWYWFLRYDPRAAQRWFDDALAASGPAPPVAHALARSWRSYYGAITDGPHPHLTDGRAALEDIRATGHPTAIATTSLMYASTLNRLGRHAEAIELLAQIHPVLADRQHGFGLAMHDTVLSTALARTGRLDEALEAADRSIERFHHIGDAWALVEPLGTLAAISAARGDLERAERAYDQLVDRSRSLELPGYLTYWLLSRANIRTLRNDDPSAAADFNEALQWSNSAVNTAIASVGLGRALSRLGEPAAGYEHCERAVVVFRQLGRNDGTAVALVGAALCHVDGDDPAAFDLAAEAIAADPELGDLATAATIAAVHADTTQQAVRRWIARYLPSLPGEPVATLAADAHQLLAAVEHRPTAGSGSAVNA